MAASELVALTLKNRGVPVVINPTSGTPVKTYGICTVATEEAQQQTRAIGLVYSLVIPADSGGGAGPDSLVDVDGIRYKVLSYSGGQIVWQMYLGEVYAES